MTKTNLFIGLIGLLIWSQAGMSQPSHHVNSPVNDLIGQIHFNSAWERKIQERAAQRNTVSSTSHTNPRVDKRPTVETRYVKARHQFKPQKQAANQSVNEFVKQLNLDKKKAVEAKAAFNQALHMIYSEAKKLNRENNMSFAIAFLFGSAYSVLYAEEYDPSKFEPLAQLIDQVLGSEPGLDNIKNSEKQRLVNLLFLHSTLMLSLYENAVEIQDKQTAEQAKTRMTQFIEPFGMNTKNLKQILDSV